MLHIIYTNAHKRLPKEMHNKSKCITRYENHKTKFGVKIYAENTDCRR